MHRAYLIYAILLFWVSIAAFAQGKITIDPNAGAPAAQEEKRLDPRLDQKITYQVKLRQTSDLTDDLTKLTGITFYAGSLKSDWRVREDCCTVQAKDIPLRDLMASIAHTMKFRWSRGGKDPNWTYRLVENKAAIAKVEREVQAQKARDRAERVKRLEMLKSVGGMSADELARLKEVDPKLFLYAKAGMLHRIIEVFDQAPAVREAWLAGDELKVTMARLPSRAQTAVLEILRVRLAEEAKDSRYGDRAKNELARLDENSSRISIDLYKSIPSYPIGSLIINSFAGSLDLSLHAPRSESARLRAMADLRLYEEKRPFPDIWREMREQFLAADRKERENAQPTMHSYTQEPLLDHSQEPDFGEPLKDKLKATTITGLIASAADMTGYAIVTDDFRGRIKLDIEKGLPMKRLFTRIAGQVSHHNWRKSADVIEIWNVNWYDNRNARVSKAWLDGFRKRFKEAGTLDIDDLVQIASLTDAQLEKNIMRDEVLTYVMDSYHYQPERRNLLKAYATMTPAQKLAIFSDTGLAFADCSPEQRELVIKLIMGQSIPQLEGLDLTALNARVTCTKQSQAGRFVYTLKAFIGDTPIPGQFYFRTPLYMRPTRSQPAAPQGLPVVDPRDIAGGGEY